MSDTLLAGLGGVAGVLTFKDDESKLQFQDTTETAVMSFGIVMFIIPIALIILFLVMAYKMFPENKGMHLILTMVLGLFWLIPAMLYYLYVKKGYHMKGFRIIKDL